MPAYFGSGTKLTVLGKKNNVSNFKSSRNTKWNDTKCIKTSKIVAKVISSLCLMIEFVRD